VRQVRAQPAQQRVAGSATTGASPAWIRGRP
jgi:hypothetical protein